MINCGLYHIADEGTTITVRFVQMEVEVKQAHGKVEKIPAFGDLRIKVKDGCLDITFEPEMSIKYRPIVEHEPKEA